MLGALRVVEAEPAGRGGGRLLHRVLWPLAAAGVLTFACSGEPALSAATSFAATPAPAQTALAATTTTPEAAASAVAVEATPPPPSASGPADLAAPVDLSQVVVPPGDGVLVVVDPGHGGDEVGAAANGIVEKGSNLEMGRRVERLLTQAGYRVLMTRHDAGRAVEGVDGAGQPQGFSAQRRDLQARVDLANTAGAALFISLHSNGLSDPSADGVETYYNAARPFATQSRLLAQSIQRNVVEEMARSGYRVRDRGTLDDSCLRAFQGVCFPLFVLGPSRETSRDEVLRRGGDPAALGFSAGQAAIVSRATQMPGALVELLFVSNAEDARLLAADESREALARGVVLGIARFLAGQSG